MSAPSQPDRPRHGPRRRPFGLGPLGGVRARLASALADFGRVAYRRLPLSPALRWQLTRLFFAATGPLLRTTPVWRTYMRERAWRERHGERPVTSMRGFPDWRPAPRAAGRTDLVFFGVIDWEFRIQRPQHLARALAEQGHRIFYVSPLFIDAREPGFDVERIDTALPIYSLRLCASQRPILHEAGIPTAVIAQLREGIARCLRWAEVRDATSVLHHPAWYPVARTIPDARVVYDWIDDHADFPRAGPHVAALQETLLARADLVVSSATRLDARAREVNRSTARIPNAAEVEHFARASEVVSTDGRQTIGYYGAIAEWIDTPLLRAVAERYPDCTLLLIGEDTARVGLQLRDLENVVCVPEVDYADLPEQLARMDVCLIPFKASKLMSSTNPVKVYEYLSAGRPVVTTDLPELRETEINALLFRCSEAERFVARVGDALAEPVDDPIRARRRRYAERNTWRERGAAFAAALARIPEPLVSVIVVTYGNLALTRDCIESIRADDTYGNVELVIVDNASTDGTPAYLNDLARSSANVHVTLCSQNAGFAAAVNVGLAQARGDYLVILNNDTVVTPGWLRGLVGHLSASPEIGLLGPVSNGVDNEARVFTRYTHPSEMADEILDITRTNMGEVFDLESLSFFCVMLPRRVYEEIGRLDEGYGFGYFEDDDYCRRVAAIGLRICCTSDVYVHHSQSAAFDKLGSRERRTLFEGNRARFEARWGPWHPHRTRVSPPELAADAEASDAVPRPGARRDHDRSEHRAEQRAE